MPRNLHRDLAVRVSTGLIFILAMLFASLARGQANGPKIIFSSAREGELILAEARVDLPVSPSLAWEVLTDYEHYPNFITSMRESKIVSRSSAGLVVEQKGSFGFLFFSQDIEIRLLVSEYPQNLIVARSIKGSFREMLGRYELQQVGNGVRLFYSGRMVPEFSLPPVFGTSIIHYALHRNFTEMVDEIVRRGAEARLPERMGRTNE